MDLRKRKGVRPVGVTKCVHVVDRASDSVIVSCDVGASIEEVSNAAVRLAKAANLRVQFAFNGVLLAAHATTDPAKLIHSYQKQID